MPMRFFSQEQLHEELRKAGLRPTDLKTLTGRLWETDDGQFLSVPEHSDSYPGWVVDDLLDRVGRLYRPPRQ